VKGLGPEFVGKLPNLTIKQGCDASFTCVVRNAGRYEVGLFAKQFVNAEQTYTELFLLNSIPNQSHRKAE